MSWPAITRIMPFAALFNSVIQSGRQQDAPGNASTQRVMSPEDLGVDFGGRQSPSGGIDWVAGIAGILAPGCSKEPQLSAFKDRNKPRQEAVGVKQFVVRVETVVVEHTSD